MSLDLSPISDVIVEWIAKADDTIKNLAELRAMAQCPEDLARVAELHKDVSRHRLTLLEGSALLDDLAKNPDDLPSAVALGIWTEQVLGIDLHLPTLAQVEHEQVMKIRRVREFFAPMQSPAPKPPMVN